jgi:hypothetical protein
MAPAVYTVTNTYGIAGESTHRTPEAALRSADRREGDGWVVEDQDGARWMWAGVRKAEAVRA